jgi:hypothetical protein
MRPGEIAKAGVLLSCILVVSNPRACRGGQAMDVLDGMEAGEQTCFVVLLLDFRHFRKEEL